MENIKKKKEEARLENAAFWMAFLGSPSFAALVNAVPRIDDLVLSTYLAVLAGFAFALSVAGFVALFEIDLNKIRDGRLL